MQETWVRSWVGKSPWKRAWHPFQFSCLEIPIDRGAWQATVHEVTKSRTSLKQPSRHAHMHRDLYSIPRPNIKWNRIWKRTYLYLYLNHIAIHLKLTQYCQSTILLFKKTPLPWLKKDVISHWMTCKAWSLSSKLLACPQTEERGFSPPWRPAALNYVLAVKCNPTNHKTLSPIKESTFYNGEINQCWAVGLKETAIKYNYNSNNMKSGIRCITSCLSSQIWGWLANVN